MNPRRELVGAIVLCLLGSGLALLAVSRVWVTAQIDAVAPLPADTLSFTGIDLAPSSRALALLGLACVAALPATRRLARSLVGVLLVVVGAGIVVAAGRVLADPLGLLALVAPVRERPGAGVWAYVAVLSGLVLAADGLLVVVRGRAWPSMSARYDAPSKERPAREPSLWESLDRGEDPTAGGADTGR